MPRSVGPGRASIGAREPLPARVRLAAMPVSRRSRPAVRPLWCALLAGVLALAGCGSTDTVQLPGTGPLVTVQMRGGMCPAGACETTVILERDGRIHAAAKPPNDLGHVSAEAMATLSAAIAATDYAAIRSHPFIGQCPVAFDGQELIFEFAVGAGTQRIASCEVAIDWGHPLFVAVGAALRQWIPIPTT